MKCEDHLLYLRRLLLAEVRHHIERRLIIGHQLGTIILLNLAAMASYQIPLETAALLTTFAVKSLTLCPHFHDYCWYTTHNAHTHTHTHGRRSCLASFSQPNDVLRATEGAWDEMRDFVKNHKCSLRSEDYLLIQCNSIQKKHSMTF